MNNAQNNSTMDLLAKDIKPGMIIKLDRFYATVTDVEVIEKQNGTFKYNVKGTTIEQMTYNPRTRKMDRKVPAGCTTYWTFMKSDSRVTWKHI